MYKHCKDYASFHEDGSAWAMLKQAEEFLLGGMYILNITDVCVAATANYLCMNLYIFENLGGKVVIIQQRSAIEKATKGLFLPFSHKPSGTGHENHYDAIVDMESIPFHPIITQATPATQATPVTQASPVTQATPVTQASPVTQATPVTQAAETTQATKTTQAAETTQNHPHAKSKHRLPNLPQLEPDFEPHFQVPNTQILPPKETEFIPPPAVHQRKWWKSTINMSAFSNITPEVVDRMPWIPDWDHIYLIRFEEDYWHDKQIDGQPLLMSKSSHEGLDGIKKFGTYRGSFICVNDDCPISTVEHTQNRVDFTKEKFGAYSCSNCKVFVQCKQCNA